MVEQTTTLWTRDSDEFETLTDAYFANIAEEDLLAINADGQRARVQSHVQLANSRTTAQHAVAVVNFNQRSVVQVSTDDMPYLVDSVTSEVTRCGHAIALVVHPILMTMRGSQDAALKSVQSLPTQGRALSSGDTQAMPSLAAFIDEQERGEVESWIAVELDRIIDDAAAEVLVEGLKKVLGDVRACQRDQASMIGQAQRAASTIRRLDGVPDRDESAEFVEWMGQGNFLFLGYREYELIGDQDTARLEPIQGTGLGILADTGSVPRPRTSSELSAASRARALQPKALVITKANSRSTVRRRSYMDYVAVKSFDDQGNVTGERRFLGLFSQRAYTQSISTIPLLRSRAKQLLARSGFSPDSHSGSDLVQILETYPRSELMQMDIAEVEDVAWQILQLQERRRIKLFVRQDHFGRFMTALLYLPRDRYNTQTRQRAEAELMQHIEAESIDFTVLLSDSVLARVFFRIRLKPESEGLSISVEDLEANLARSVRSWGEGIAEQSAAEYSAAHADRISNRWGEAFPPEYRVRYEVSDALHDAEEFETLEAEIEAGPRLYFYAPSDGDPADMRLKLYLTDAKTLSDTLPIIDDFGLELLDERSYVIDTPDEQTFYLYDLGLGYPQEVDAYATTELFKDAYRRVLTGSVESDEFSRLVLQLQMDVRRVTVLRAYAKYMRQLGMPHSYDFMADALIANPEVTRALISVFTAKFDPHLDSGREQAVEACRANVHTALESVKTLDADRVLSALFNLVEATDRTNLYQGHEWVSMKLRPQDIDAAPAPRPAHEIWVYSPQVEGSHLRFERIARGGLRWSDRAEDFRTEVLGLVKAQMTKNSVIVPSGAKGAFYPKQLPDPSVDRKAWVEAGRQAYITFIRALLDVTDNQKRDDDAAITIVPPDQVVSHDEDDPYLVVAADKGTAAFSDTANAISAEYGHWLGDAFASGGSVGYDHKAMGITARGAWESVKSHFSTMGHDTQSQDFTVIGIGDMGGDVFGNGMLRSEHIQLVAAFNHLHIFIDPNPDPQVSFKERERLFTDAQSGWGSYDEQLISEGGGVFSREARSIEISPQMRERFGISAERLTPPELITALLKAPVDLLYNGGIGTYIKAEHESHDQVGDRANNGIRINGADLQVKVVAEGGNLGLTQAGRIEAAQRGILVNTDAIDNSAGVESSDYEVNIKILLDALVASQQLDSQSRNELLGEMTDEVADLVLQTNKDQNVLLLAERHRLSDWSPSFGRLITWLEGHAGLDRALEVLPTDTDMQDRLKEDIPPLTSPELSVLAAYAKIHLKGALAESELPADPWLQSTLDKYFPEQLSAQFSDALPEHPLALRIIANKVANDVINMAGSTFVFRTSEETFASPVQVVRAFLIARELFQLEKFDAAMRSLPVDFPSDVWAETYVDMRRLLDRAVRWLVNHEVEGGSLEDALATYRQPMESLYGQLSELLAGPDAQRVEQKRQEMLVRNVGEDLATWYAELFESFSLLDIAELARIHDLDSRSVAEVYYAVYAEFDVDLLLDHITGLPRKDKWQALARGALRDDLYFVLREITESILTTTGQQSAPQRLDAWKSANASAMDRAERLTAELRQREYSMASVTVLLRHLRGLTGT